MAGIGAVFSLLGTVVSAAGTIAAGQAQMEQAKAQAEMQRREAVEEQARYQRAADQENKKRDLVLSKQQNIAASSGFSAQDTSASGSATNIWNAGTYNSNLYTYTGERNKSLGIYQGDLTEWAGVRAYEAAQLSAMGTVLGGFGGMFGSFGGGGYTPASSAQPTFSFFGSGNSVGGMGGAAPP